jgi:predicted outer membrane repeat protein
MGCTALGGTIVYVDANATGDYPTIQAAIDDASDGDVVVVKPGVYTGEGNRDIDFLGKAITVRSTDPNAEKIVAATIIDCNRTETNPHRAFYFHTGEGADSVLDGLTVVNFVGDWPGNTGAICCRSSPTIKNCMLINNKAAFANCVEGPCGTDGGGLVCAADYAADVTRPRIVNCKFIGNWASGAGAGLSTGSCSPIVIGCTFRGNSAASGGAVHCGDGGSATFVNCTFGSNSSDDSGGAVYASSITWFYRCRFINCIFAGNTAADAGGAVYSYYSHLATANCTFVGNRARSGNAVACDSRESSYPAEFSITNCILWNGGNEIWNNDGTPVLVNFSNLWGGKAGIYDPRAGLQWGRGNIEADPYFVAAGRWVSSGNPPVVAEPNDPSAFWVDGDYHLKSQAGRWDPSSTSWIYDDVTSACIDLGDPSNPVGHEPFPKGGRINMGAYGGTAEASKSYFGGLVCETIIAGDINGDCKVDFADFLIMAFHWLEDKNL